MNISKRTFYLSVTLLVKSDEMKTIKQSNNINGKILHKT